MGTCTREDGGRGGRKEERDEGREGEGESVREGAEKEECEGRVWGQ